MERRWWLLGALLVIAIAGGFGVGIAVKSTSGPAQVGSLASNDSATEAQATVTRPRSSALVPPLKATAKANASHTTTSTASGATSTTGVTTATVTQTTSTPPPSNPTTASHTTVQSSTTGGGGGGGGAG